MVIHHSKKYALKALISIYIFLMIIECVFLVPYDLIEIFRSKQNVPHLIVTGSGYTDVFDIERNTANLGSKDTVASGKRLSSARMMFNIFITTALFAAAFVFIVKLAYTGKGISQNVFYAVNFVLFVLLVIITAYTFLSGTPEYTNTTKDASTYEDASSNTGSDEIYNKHKLNDRAKEDYKKMLEHNR